MAVMALAATVAMPASVAAQTASVPLRLSLKQAVELALEPDGNNRIRLAAELVEQARAQSVQQRASLLPNISGSVNQQSRTNNLEAIGVQFNVPVPGFVRPRFVGPFETFDARARATQRLWDLGAIRRYGASKAGIAEARSSDEQTRDEVAALTAARYTAALRSEARVQAMRANVELAESLLDLAQSQRTVGTGTAIEVTRARVQLADERQQLLVAENEGRRSRLELLRALGLALDVTLELGDELTYDPVPVQTVDEALATALESRADMAAQREREERMGRLYGSVRGERWPSLYGFADYGSLGSSARRALPTRSVGLEVKVPIFDGGLRCAREIESRSRVDAERVRTEDLRQQIELEVRLALDDIHSAREQIEVAEEGLKLATEEVERARRRYTAGVSTSLEVTDAQTRLERSRDNRIAALFQYNLSRIELGAATGTIRSMILDR